MSFDFQAHQKAMENPFEEFAGEVMAAQTADTLTVLFGTDVHYIRTYGNYAPVYEKLQEMVGFSRFVGADLLALTGDLVDGNAPLSCQYRDLLDVVSLVKGASTGAVALSKGNHDDCSWWSYQKKLGADSVISPEQWYTHVVNPVRTVFPLQVDAQNVCGGYYYIDYPVQKIRVFNLNTSDCPLVLDEQGQLVQKYCAQWCFGLQEQQLQWLADALRFEEEGWSVLFMSHASPYITADMHNRDIFMRLVKAFQNGEAGTVSSADTHYTAEVTYDFSANRSHDVLVYLAGHIHVDRTDVVDGVTTVSSLNLLGFNHGQEAFLVEIPGVGTVGQDLYNGWDCMLIDKATRTLTAKRFGRRELDRVIKF